MHAGAGVQAIRIAFELEQPRRLLAILTDLIYAAPMVALRAVGEDAAAPPAVPTLDEVLAVAGVRSSAR
jgi:hypothetical protein